MLKKYSFQLLLLSLLLHLVYFVLLFSKKVKIDASDESADPPGYFTRLAEIEKKEVPNQAIIFLGNSLTAGYNWQDSLHNKRVVNMGISGDNTIGVKKRLPNILKHQPAQIFLEIGINDMRRFGLGYAVPKNFTPDSIAINYEKILMEIKEKSPKTSIFIQSIFPVIDNSAVSCEECPVVIVRVNQELAALAQKHGCTYVDLYSKFEKNGRMQEQFTYDGLHLNKLGYQVWCKNVEHLLK